MAAELTFNLRLRAVRMEDAGLLLAWRNDPQTIAASFQGGLVMEDAHLHWLRASLASSERTLLIAEMDGLAVGTARIDELADAWELSWTVAPEKRGQGIGGKLVATALLRIEGRVIARIKSGNQASMKIAKAAGLRLARTVDGIAYWERKDS